MTDRFGLPPLERGVEIDDVDPARAGRVEAPRDRDRIVVVGRLHAVVAPQQPHDLALAEIDRRKEIHGLHATASTKFFNSCIPTAPDFSGWNCVAHTGPLSIIGREPTAVLAPGRDDTLVGGLGRVRVHEVQPRRIREIGRQPRAVHDLERVPPHLRQAHASWGAA